MMPCRHLVREAQYLTRCVETQNKDESRVVKSAGNVAPPEPRLDISRTRSALSVQLERSACVLPVREGYPPPPMLETIQLRCIPPARVEDDETPGGAAAAVGAPPSCCWPPALAAAPPWTRGLASL